jgi:hypothetical protein
MARGVMRTAGWLCAGGLLVLPNQGLGAGLAAGQQAGALVGQQTRAGAREVQTEVVGLELTGSMPFEKLSIDDLDSVVTPSGDHLVPLRRLLGAFQVDSAFTEGLLSFGAPAPAGPRQVVVDTALGVMRLDGLTQPIVVVTGISDLTKNREVYVDPETVALSLSLRLEWNDQLFAFVGKTEQAFPLWDHFGESLLAIETTRIPPTLPELFPPATPRRLSLDFIEFELRPYITATGSEHAQPAALAVDSPKQTFWGSAFGGRYRVQIGQPYVSGRQSDRSSGAMSPITVDRFEWTHTRPGAEIAVGDSVYGVSDLIFPVMRTTGLRFSGVMGFDVDARGGRAPGMGGSFSRPQVFDGAAPNGSQVELFLNGRPIQTQTVIAGTFRFEEVRLAPGTLNSVRIRITEPGGITRIVERSVFGRSIQLPKGGFAHLGGVGTNRDFRNWTTWGLTGAERVLFGVTDSLTIGATWAGQRGSGPLSASRVIGGTGAYPTSSVHQGGQVSWLPSEHLQLTGDLAFSNAHREHEAYGGRAYRLKTDLFPRREMRLSSQWFSYSPGFFNGDNLWLRDRAGYTFDFFWDINDRVRATASGGSLRNNLDGGAVDPFGLDVQKVELIVGITPRLSALVGASRVADPESDGGSMVYTGGVQANPYKSVQLEASFSRGASPSAVTDTELSSGLTIPGFSVYELQTASAVVRVPLNLTNTLGGSYFRGPGGNRTSIVHSFSTRATPVRLTTEAGWDARARQPFLSERAEYHLDRTGRKSVGIDVRYELGHWTSMVHVTFGELFRNDGGVPRPMADPRFSAENGAIYGKVFVDANADGRRDPGEPGMEGVQVVSDNGTKMVTDENGSFVIPASGQTESYRVFLDIESVPAIYSPTQAIQTANVRSGNLTEINLGVTPLNSVSGIVQMPSADDEGQPIAGARVLLRRVSDNEEVGYSITGNNGAYYLSDIRPGQYSVQVDPQTVPAGAAISDHQVVEIRPATEPQDLKLSPIHVQRSLSPSQVVTR